MENYEEDKRIFLAALKVASAERAEFLRTACPDEASRARVESLLRHHLASDETAESTEPGVVPPIASTVPSQVDEFRIIRVLGQGGMGVVYLAQDTILGRHVALKILAGHLTGSDRALARFRDEARNSALLNHPAIVPVYKFGFDGERHYIVSEYIAGETLAQFIHSEAQRRILDQGVEGVRVWQRRSAEIIASVAAALDCSHNAGIVHCDVKPSNILLDASGRPHLTDFGIASHLAQETRTISDVVGSCHYMSPEQATAQKNRIDQRSDVFSLGVVFYEMLALRRPFDGSDIHQVLQAVASSAPRRIREFQPRTPKDLETICAKALEKAPIHRYQTAAHMGGDLRCFLNGTPILARPPSIPRRVLRWSWQHRRSLFTFTTLLLIVGLGLAFWHIRNLRNAELAWVRASTNGTSCHAFLQSCDATTLRLQSTATALGSADKLRLGLAPGQYRLTIVRDSDGAFCEFNLVLMERGTQNESKIRVVDAPQVSIQESEAELVGVFRSATEIADNMLLVPGGEYQLWREYVNRRLKGNNVLEAFWMDRTEVSNREYKEFVEATHYPAPAFWNGVEFETIADLPVVRIALDDAEAYARWRGKRLPTLFEWQAAARGINGNLYPDGNDLPTSAPAYALDPSRSDELYREETVATKLPAVIDVPGGLLHTFSNVCEITGTVDIRQRQVFLTGRGWAQGSMLNTLAMFLSVPIKPPGTPQPLLAGFRCAKSAHIPPRRDP